MVPWPAAPLAQSSFAAAGLLRLFVFVLSTIAIVEIDRATHCHFAPFALPTIATGSAWCYLRLQQYQSKANRIVVMVALVIALGCLAGPFQSQLHDTTAQQLLAVVLLPLAMSLVAFLMFRSAALYFHQHLSVTVLCSSLLMGIAAVSDQSRTFLAIAGLFWIVLMPTLMLLYQSTIQPSPIPIRDLPWKPLAAIAAISIGLGTMITLLPTTLFSIHWPDRGQTVKTSPPQVSLQPSPSGNSFSSKDANGIAADDSVLNQSGDDATATDSQASLNNGTKLILSVSALLLLLSGGALWFFWPKLEPIRQRVAQMQRQNIQTQALRKLPRVEQLYQRMLAELAKAKSLRYPPQTELEFSRFQQLRWPLPIYTLIDEITADYVAWRYGQRSIDESQLAQKFQEFKTLLEQEIARRAGESNQAATNQPPSKLRKRSG